MTQREETNNDNIKEPLQDPALSDSKRSGIIRDGIIRTGEIRTVVTTLYLLQILVMFPLYVENRYQAMGDCKWKFYCAVTLPYLAVMLLTALPDAVRCIRDRRRPRVGLCDLIVGAYGICVLISFWLGDDRQALWKGATGWHMGVAAQLLFVGSYLAVSRSRVSAAWVMGCNAVGSGICFLIGILQRLGFDFLNMYYGIPNVAISDFLSTIGNRTWMSGYACAVFPVGVYLYWRAGACVDGGTKAVSDRTWNHEIPWQRLLWGGYSALAFIGLAATYSDSAYVGLAVLFFALGVLSVGNGRKMLSFGRVLCLWFASSLLMCGLREMRRGFVRDERGLSVYVYRWQWMFAGLIVCVLFTVLIRLYYVRRPGGLDGAADAKRRGRMQRGCVLAACAGCGLLILFVVCNTCGVLERFFSVTVRSPYLYFDNSWGDMRGGTWKMVCEMFAGLPLEKKLFGVGADGFAVYSYSIAEYAQRLSAVWGNAILTNAHNEWLNMFFCQGIIGGLAYLGIFAGGIIACLCGREERTDPLAQAIGLCLLAYVAHNFFCYQQICATGPVFVLFGAAMARLRYDAIRN